jgi:hypothetical protein
MYRLDLKEARKKWLQSFQDARQRTEAEQSDFLTYRDAAGLVADFHSLRRLYISRIVRSGASPKVAQKLARHCEVRLTLDRYAHAALHDRSAAMDALSDMLPAAGAREALASTRTDGKNSPLMPRIGKNSLGPFLGPQPAILGDSERQAETEKGKPQGNENHGKIKVSACFSGKEKERGPSRIRTGDGGFAIRSAVSPSDETPSTSDDTPILFAPGLRENQNPILLDADLQCLLDAWPTLPEADQNAFRAVVRGILGKADGVRGT